MKLAEKNKTLEVPYQMLWGLWKTAFDTNCYLTVIKRAHSPPCYLTINKCAHSPPLSPSALLCKKISVPNLKKQSQGYLLDP